MNKNVFIYIAGFSCEFSNERINSFLSLRWQRLSREFDALSKKLAAALKELDAETAKRVDFENRNKTLQESITFQNQVHRKVWLILRELYIGIVVRGVWYSIG